MAYDLLIKDSKIIDEAGNPWYRGDIAVSEGKIIKIRPKLNEEAKKSIDANRQVVCPGFMDIHSHTDFVLPLSPPERYLVNTFPKNLI